MPNSAHGALSVDANPLGSQGRGTHTGFHQWQVSLHWAKKVPFLSVGTWCESRARVNGEALWSVAAPSLLMPVDPKVKTSVKYLPFFVIKVSLNVPLNFRAASGKVDSFLMQSDTLSVCWGSPRPQNPG